MIPVIESWIAEEELAQLREVVKSNWVTEGEKTREFERRIADYCGTRHAIAVSNGTVALYIALKALGIGEGDEVIVPDFTFIASANSIRMAGATPVLVDVDEKTFNIDPNCIEQAITSKTKAIMPVHIYGQSADMDRICQVGEAYGLWVVEDAAQGMGVRFNSKHVGGFGHVGCLSFYGNKTITTGEGGMVLTDSDEIAERCFVLKNHGRKTTGTYVHEHIGYNFRITDIQSAIGLAQLSKIGEILDRKKRNEGIYKENLLGVSGISFPYVDPRCDHVPWFVNILVQDPQKLSDHLARDEIGSRRFFYPVHRQPCYNISGQFPNSVRAYERGLSLPSSVLLEKTQIVYVCEGIKSFVIKSMDDNTGRSQEHNPC